MSIRRPSPLADSTKETLLVQRGRIQSVTQGDVVLVDLPSASTYWKYRIGFILATLLMLSTLSFHLDLSRPLALGIAVLTVGLIWEFSERSFSWVRFLPESVTSRLVLARGLELFAEYGVYRTMGRCGALVVFSRAERRVLVLGDEALDTAMGDQGWENLAGTTAEHIEANGAIDEAALYVFDELEALLEEVFPMEYGQGQIRELAEPVVEGHSHD